MSFKHITPTGQTYKLISLYGACVVNDRKLYAAIEKKIMAAYWKANKDKQ